MIEPYYLDHAASMEILPEVRQRLGLMLTTHSGNPHAQHGRGMTLKSVIDSSTQYFSKKIKSAPRDIIWTSSATESNNMAIHAAYEHLNYLFNKVNFYYHPLSHSSIISPALALGAKELHVDYTGKIDRNIIKNLINTYKISQTGLVLLLPLGHSETGLLEDFSYLSSLIKECHNIWIHVDAAQALGKIPVDTTILDYITSMSFSGHKIGGPVGIGALYLKSRPSKFYKAFLLGGGQQDNRRSGTVSAPLVDSFVTALSLNNEELWNKVHYCKQLLEDFLIASGYFKSLNLENSLPHILGIIITQKRGKILELMKKSFYFSQTTACRSGNSKISHALLSLGIESEEQKYYCRISFPLYFNEKSLQEVKNIFSKEVFNAL